MSVINASLQNVGGLRKVLVAGWFSFEYGHATGGDILALEVTCQWLTEAGFLNYDIAYDPPFTGGVNWRTVDPKEYSHVVFVCGPFENKLYEAEFLTRFSDNRLIGLNLSMLPPLHEWNPFDLLYERNSTRTVRPDMVFLSKRPKVPVIGVCLVESYPGAWDAEAHTAIQRLINSREVAIVNIDTRLDKNSTHLRTPAEIESLIARVDALVTTRLHGAVMAIKNGVPVVPIDPEAGGAKVVLQMKKIGWPLVFTADNLNDDALSKALDYCLTEEARKKAQTCYRHATDVLEQTKNDLIHELNSVGSLENNFVSRTAKKEIPAWAKEIFAQSAVKQKKKTFHTKNILKRLAFWLLPGGFIYMAQRLRKQL